MVVGLLVVATSLTAKISKVEILQCVRQRVHLNKEKAKHFGQAKDLFPGELKACPTNDVLKC